MTLNIYRVNEFTFILQFKSMLWFYFLSSWSIITFYLFIVTQSQVWLQADASDYSPVWNLHSQRCFWAIKSTLVRVVTDHVTILHPAATFLIYLCKGLLQVNGQFRLFYLHVHRHFLNTCKVSLPVENSAYVITLAFLFTKETKRIEVSAAQSQILFLFHTFFLQVASIFLKHESRSLGGNLSTCALS